MSEEVFEDTPIAGYLKNVGVEDWGIEDTDDESASPPAAPDPAQKPPIATDNVELRPLALVEGVSHMRRERFRAILRACLSQRLTPQETSEFLEKFRYSAMSSDLLRELPIYTAWSADTDSRRRTLLFDPRKPWVILRVASPQWLGGGGCVVAISVLLTWRSRASSPHEKSRIALVVALLVLLYLFATARKRLLRSLRSKAITFMEDFIGSSKQFDGDVVRALRALQELEVVSAGLAPHAKPSPLFRSRTILGRKIRAALSSSLTLLTEAYIDAVRDCASMGPLSEIEQLLEMFDILKQQSELGFEMSPDAIGFLDPVLMGDYQLSPVSDLKLALRKAHLARRIFMCCALAVPSSGECQPVELETWTVLTDHLLNCSELARQLSNVITKERLNPVFSDRMHEPKDRASAAPIPTGLHDLAATVRHLNATLELLQSTPLADEEYRRHEKALEVDLGAINDDWARLRRSRNAEPAPSFDLSSPTVVASTPMSDEGSTFSIFAPPDLTDSTTDITESSVHPSIWETVVPPPAKQQQNSSLSRDERIRLMQQTREKLRDQKPKVDPRSSLALELDNIFRGRVRG